MKLFISLCLISACGAQAICQQTAAPRQALDEARQLARQHRFAKAIEVITKAIDAGSASADAFHYRGRWHFCNGNAAKSVADFDKLVKLAPQQSNWLWERGISLYYIGKHKEGAEQFVKYQSVEDADVENAVWRYFCQQKYDGKQKARKDMLPIQGDPRVAMMEIYRLFKGESTPNQVLAEVESSPTKGDIKKNELMHAHLYLSMYYDSEGNADKAKEHIDLAVKQFEQGHYMWSVAVMHQKHLKQLAQKGKAKRKVSSDKSE